MINRLWFIVYGQTPLVTTDMGVSIHVDVLHVSWEKEKNLHRIVSKVQKTRSTLDENGCASVTPNGDHQAEAVRARRDGNQKPRRCSHSATRPR